MSSKTKLIHLTTILLFFILTFTLNYFNVNEYRDAISINNSNGSIHTDYEWKFPINKIIIHRNYGMTVNTTLKSLNFVQSNKTTLIVMAYKNHPPLIELIAQYTNKYFVNIFYEIILIWNNPINMFDIDSVLKLRNNKIFVQIIIYQQYKNSLSNRWMVTNYHSFSTQSIIFMDDDYMFNLNNFKCLFNTWLHNSNKIIAPAANNNMRYFIKNIQNNTYAYQYKMDGFDTNKMNHFEMLLPTGITMSVNYLYKISQYFIQYNLIQIIDQQSAHCDDIAMSLSLSKFVGGKTFLLGINNFNKTSNDRDKYQQKLAGTNIRKRNIERTECLNMIINKLTDNKLDNDVVIHHYKHNNNNNTSDVINCRNIPWYCPRNACI